MTVVDIPARLVARDVNNGLEQLLYENMLRSGRALLDNDEHRMYVLELQWLAIVMAGIRHEAHRRRPRTVN